MPDPTAYLTAAEVRERVGRSGSEAPLAGVSDADIEELIDEFEDILERYRRYSEIPRTITEVVEVASFTDRLILKWPLVRSVTSVTVNGTALSASTYEVDKAPGIIRRVTGLFSPADPATVVYAHGSDSASRAAKRAGIAYVQSVAEAERSGQGRDIITQGIDGGTTRYSTPSWADGRPTGWLEVDRLLNSLPDYRTPEFG